MYWLTLFTIVVNSYSNFGVKKHNLKIRFVNENPEMYQTFQI